MSMPDRPEVAAKADSELRRVEQQRAPIAQLLLVARLRARNRRDLARDSLERAAHVIFVTCKNWFSSSRKPDNLPQPLPKEGPDAHRHD
ncbi:hypothetical protein [Polaromonas sp. A23]|uniref:hypothetical protein n=1 Tax=Polaromonas sp. A23 TaxID=1944133 RepID=UPI00098466D1|nr:hypothetical protein [Polaromonas sp. A23]OOG41851.1 hypothetical protein B0B52_11060 [Polaromonas sp. A23]